MRANWDTGGVAWLARSQVITSPFEQTMSTLAPPWANPSARTLPGMLAAADEAVTSWPVAVSKTAAVPAA